MESAREFRVEKPVRLIFAGGFLGSGKTTALAEIAKRLIQRGMRVGIITNDQTENLVDTVIIKQMLSELNVPVEEVVEGCFCCKFDELISHMEKILTHEPDVLLGEPVGSCTDFVAAVANPIKINYKDAFRFAPFSILVDPERLREMLLGEAETIFPEEVAYLFEKQLEEADIIILNKIDLLTKKEKERLLVAIEERFPEKDAMPISAKDGHGMDEWMETLLSGQPGANTVLRQIDYDRYATAEAVLGWLNAAIKITSINAFNAQALALHFAQDLQKAFKIKDGEIGHLKFVMTQAGKAMWTNITHLTAEPVISGDPLGLLSRVSLILNARVRMEPDDLENIVRESLSKTFRENGMQYEIEELQCFSPAYPEPPYLIRE